MLIYALPLLPWLLPIPFLWQLGLAWGGYLCLFYAKDRFSIPWWVLGLGFVPLLLRLGEPAILADDYLRYLFDGKLLLKGIIPYGKRPLDLPLFARHWVPKPEIPTIYPPLAEGLFALAAWSGSGLAALRLLNGFGLLLFCGAALFTWGRERGKQAIGLTLFCPLVQQELFHSAHIDAWVLPFLFLALGLMLRGRAWGAGVGLGLASLIKFTPALVLLPWLMRLDAPARLKASLGFLGVLLLGFLPFYPLHPFAGLLVFYRSLDGVSPFYLLLRLALDQDLARIILAGIGLPLGFFWLWSKPFLQEGVWVLGLLFLITPPGFPWYLVPLLPLMREVRFRYVLFFLVPLHFAYYLSSPVWLAALASLGATLFMREQYESSIAESST